MAEKETEWGALEGGGELYKVRMQHLLTGKYLDKRHIELLEGIPNMGVQCLKCQKRRTEHLH